MGPGFLPTAMAIVPGDEPQLLSGLCDSDYHGCSLGKEDGTGVKVLVF